MILLLVWGIILSLIIGAALLVIMCINLADASYHGDWKALLRGVVAGLLVICAGLFAFVLGQAVSEERSERHSEWTEELRQECEDGDGLVMETPDGEYYGCISNPEQLRDQLNTELGD